MEQTANDIRKLLEANSGDLWLIMCDRLLHRIKVPISAIPGPMLLNAYELVMYCGTFLYHENITIHDITPSSFGISVALKDILTGLRTYQSQLHGNDNSRKYTGSTRDQRGK